jgi:uncharacterized protein (TIGR02301 family)
MRFFTVTLLACLLAAPAQSQGWRTIQAQPIQAELEAAPDGPGPAGAVSGSRNALLQELAGAIGAVHYFTVLCDGRGNQYWRDRMIALVEAEAPVEGRLRAAMIETFNDQYRERENGFSECSAAARAERSEAAARGQALSEALATPYQ